MMLNWNAHIFWQEVTHKKLLLLLMGFCVLRKIKLKTYKGTMKKPTLGVLLYFLILLQSCGYSPAWRTETVDGENSSVGKFTSIAVDSNNDPPSAYGLVGVFYLNAPIKTEIPAIYFHS